MIVDFIRTAFHTLRAYFRLFRTYVTAILGQRLGFEDSKKHLILLVWAFPPIVTGGVYRPLSFAQEAIRQGWKVTVICGPKPSSPSPAGSYLLSKLSDAVTIIQTKVTTLEPGYHWFPRIDGGFLNALAMADTESLTRSSNTVILASGPPFHSFVAGWFLAKRLDAKLVLDYRDEWTQCPFDFISFGNSDAFWERHCLNAADSIIVTTRSFRDRMAVAFPELPTSKIELIPNGYDASDFPDIDRAKSPETTEDAPITLSYLGYLANHINPSEFIATCEDAIKFDPELAMILRIEFIGKRDSEVEIQIRKSGIGALVVFRDHISKAAAVEVMRTTNALILFNPPDLVRYIPGKLFDYIASGATLLIYGTGGEVENAVSEAGCGIVVPAGDGRALAYAVRRLKKVTQPVDQQARHRWLRNHERSGLADTLLSHLDKLLLSRIS